MKIYVGETKPIFIPSGSSEGYCIDIYCHKIGISSLCPNNLEGYIYNACTKRPVRRATIIIENEFGCEACMTDERGHYKIYMPCKDVWCKIKIKKHKRYYYYATNRYIKEDKINFQIYPRTY